MTAILREGGGYFNVPNLWFDAGYAKQVPATITNVYMFLCRWEGHKLEDNHASQPIKTIASQCGCSVDVARDAIRILEQWNVIKLDGRHPNTGANVWILLALHEKAPPTPYRPRTGQKKKNEGSEKNEGSDIRDGEKSQPYQPEVYQPNAVASQQQRTPRRKASRPTDGGQSKSPRAMPRNGMAQTLVAVLYEDVLKTGSPTAYQKAVGQAQKLAKAGLVPGDVAKLVGWIREDSFRSKNGIDMGTLLAWHDKWRATLAPSTPQRQPTYANSVDPYDAQLLAGLEDEE